MQHSKPNMIQTSKMRKMNIAFFLLFFFASLIEIHNYWHGSVQWWQERTPWNGDAQHTRIHTLHKWHIEQWDSEEQREREREINNTKQKQRSSRSSQNNQVHQGKHDWDLSFYSLKQLSFARSLLRTLGHTVWNNNALGKSLQSCFYIYKYVIS